MKKSKVLGAFLAALLVIQSAALPAYAETEATEPSGAQTQPSAPAQTETDASGEIAADGEAGTDASAPADAAVPGSSMVPGGVQSGHPVIPLTEDASVTAGSHGVDGKVAAADPNAYSVKAKAAMLYDLTSDTVLFASNADERLFPASLTKVMTCMVSLDLIREQGRDFNEIVTISEELVRRVDPYGSSMELKAGEEVPLIELLYGMMVHSSNDACMAVAEYLCGSEDAFVEKMNEKAEELGCVQTHFMNVHGLHNEEHYTCARDMARILKKAIEDENFRELYSAPEHVVPATNLSEARDMVTTNYLISESVMNLYYDSRVIGGKTGFTTPAGRCLVTVSEAPGSDLKLLCVVLGAGMQVAEDGYSIISYGSFEETVGLLDFGFSHFEPTQVLSDAQSLGQFSVNGGDADVQGRIRESVNTLLPIGSGLDSISYDYQLYDDTIEAPLEKDTPLGVVRVWYQNRCLAQQELYSSATVKKPLHLADFPELDPAGTSENEISLKEVAVSAGVLAMAAAVVFWLVRRIRYAIRRAQRRRKVERRRAELEKDRRRQQMKKRLREEEPVPRRREQSRRTEQPRRQPPAQNRRPSDRKPTTPRRRG